MKSLRIFLGIAFLFHTLYILGADHLRLLPQPQQCVLAKGYFIVGKMQLSTPVLSQEWKQFVTEMGGTLTDQSASSINIKLVDAIDNVSVNKEEAYRLTITPKANYCGGCSRARSILGDADAISTKRRKGKEDPPAMCYYH